MIESARARARADIKARKRPYVGMEEAAAKRICKIRGKVAIRSQFNFFEAYETWTQIRELLDSLPLTDDRFVTFS